MSLTEYGRLVLQSFGLVLLILIFFVVLSYLPPFRKYSGLYAKFAGSCRPEVRFDPGRPYQVYCRDFDVEVKADKLDAILAAVPAFERNWSERFPDVELSDIDASRDPELHRTAARIRAATTQEVLDNTIVSLLIDHSGSMRGQSILLAARAAMAASYVLDSLGAKQEVLGFTTVRWKGGATREKWLRDGRPPYPGRLNDLLHIVYCSAGERLHARHCATMLRKDLLKENIDGEAIEWSAARLRQRAESHKYIIVVSDGAPVDDSTLLENGGAYMEHHLLSVIQRIAQAGDIQLAAIGIGHPVERYYPRSIAVAAPPELHSATLQLIEQLLSLPVTPLINT